MMVKLCQRVLDGRGMPDEWKTSVIVPGSKICKEHTEKIMNEENE